MLPFVWFVLQQQRPDLPRLLQQMHAQQLPPGAGLGPHPGLPALPGLGPGGMPPTSASAALMGLGLPPGPGGAPGASAHPLSMLSKPELHGRAPDDLKPNGELSQKLVKSESLTIFLKITKMYSFSNNIFLVLKNIFNNLDITKYTKNP